MAPPVKFRPGPVKGDSPASLHLHYLQSELLDARTIWEQLATQVALGYTDALDMQEKTLQDMKKAIQRDAFSPELTIEVVMFVLSVTSVGLAGGVVGGLIAPWVRKAGDEVAKIVYRTAVSGVAQQAAKVLVNQGATKLDKYLSSNSYQNGRDDPFKPVGPRELLVDLRLRARIASAFGPIQEAVDTMIAAANDKSANDLTGQAILNGFRQNCPLLTDAPEQSEIPSEDDAERAAELALWVAWANERDWSWWNEQYKWLDPNLWASVRRSGSEADFNAMVTQYSLSKKYALEMDPVGKRMVYLGKWADVMTVADPYFKDMYGSFAFTDLRKLRALRLTTPISRSER